VQLARRAQQPDELLLREAPLLEHPVPCTCRLAPVG
jgi:hypothetical protein